MCSAINIIYYYYYYIRRPRVKYEIIKNIFKLAFRKRIMISNPVENYVLYDRRKLRGYSQCYVLRCVAKRCVRKVLFVVVHLSPYAVYALRCQDLANIKIITEYYAAEN